MIRTLWLSLAAVVFLAVGCSPQPPAPPTLDPVVSPTSVLTQTISGYAKWGSTIQISGGAAQASGVADPYSGRFAIQVSLNNNATNSLSITATDATGTSQPTPAQIITPAPGAAIQMVLSSSTVKAGGTVSATVTVLDKNGQPNGQVVVPTVSGPSGAGAYAVSGQASPFTLTGTLSGIYTVTAALSPTVTVSQTLTVTAADPAVLTLNVANAAAPATPVNSAAAGTQLVYVYTVVDMYGNQVPQPAVAVTTNMPGATVSPVDTQGTDANNNTYYQGLLVNFVRSSNTAWKVTAHVAGTTLTQVVSVLVGADQTALVARLSLNSNITQVGNPLSYKVTVTDGFGNVVTTGLPTVSLSLSPNPTPAPTCAPTACTAASLTGTISAASAGLYQLAVNFTGTPTVVGDSQYISVINAPIPPTITIVSPASTDVFGYSASIPVSVQITYANSNNNSYTYVASGPINQTNTASGLGQQVCASLPCTAFTLNTGGPPGTFAPRPQTLIIVATDGTTGAAATKSVTFTMDPFKDINTPVISRNVIKAGQGTFAAGSPLSFPMGITVLPATNTLYIADQTTSSVFTLNLAAPFPQTTFTLVSSAFNNPSDVQLRPLTGALGTYPPAAYQGLYVGTASTTANFQVIDPANMSVTAFPAAGLVNIRSSSFHRQVTLGGSAFPAVTFAARPPNRIEVLDPTTGADLTGGNPIGMNGLVNEPWGLATVDTGNSIRLFVANGNNTISVCNIAVTTTSMWKSTCDNATNIGLVAAGGTRLARPRALAVSPTGKLYVASNGGNEVLSYDLSTLTCPAAGGCTCATASCAEAIVARSLPSPVGVAFDAAGNLYVSDSSLRAVAQIPPGGTPF